MSFIPRPKLYGACGALTGQTFSGEIPNEFQGTLDNIAIYVRANYGHKMVVTLKERKEAVIQKLENPDPDASKSASTYGNLSAKDTSSTEISSRKGANVFS